MAKKPTDQQFNEDCSALKERIARDIADFTAKHSDKRVRLSFDTESDKPGVNLAVTPRETQTYRAVAGVTVPRKALTPEQSAAAAALLQE